MSIVSKTAKIVNCQQNSKDHVKSNPHMEVLSIGFKSIIYVCNFSVDVPVHVIGLSVPVAS